MLAYLGDHQLKSDFVEEVRWHREQDRLIKGQYSDGHGDNFRGCAVGCSLHSLNKRRGLELDVSNHMAYEEHLGIPVQLARLEDCIFEGLPSEDAKLWPERFSSAISVGADLATVWPKFSLWILTDSGLLHPDEATRPSVDAVAALYRRWVDGDMPSQAEWESAAWSAESAAWSAESAARSAESAAWSAESAAWSAASAARSAARSAESAAWKSMADKLVELLEQAHAAEPA
jgi:hypothetical protein